MPLVFITMQIFLVPAALAIDEMPAELLGFFLSGAAAGMIVVNILLATTKPRATRQSDVLGAALLGLSASVALLAFNMSPLMLLASGLLAGCSGGLLSPVYTAMQQTKRAAPHPVQRTRACLCRPDNLSTGRDAGDGHSDPHRLD